MVFDTCVLCCLGQYYRWLLEGKYDHRGDEWPPQVWLSWKVLCFSENNSNYFFLFRVRVQVTLLLCFRRSFPYMRSNHCKSLNEFVHGRANLVYMSLLSCDSVVTSECRLSLGHFRISSIASVRTIYRPIFIKLTSGIGQTARQTVAVSVVR